jgi:hypothetical protein
LGPGGIQPGGGAQVGCGYAGDLLRRLRRVLGAGDEGEVVVDVLAALGEEPLVGTAPR